MAELKTKPTDTSVAAFLDKAADPKLRADCDVIISLMEKIAGEKPKMWGPGIVGFGSYHYKYESGREGDMCVTGFSPRKPAITLYVMAGSEGQAALLEKLGKYKVSKGCLYIKKLADIDLQVLENIIANGVHHIRNKYPD